MRWLLRPYSSQAELNDDSLVPVPGSHELPCPLDLLAAMANPATAPSTVGDPTAESVRNALGRGEQGLVSWIATGQRALCLTSSTGWLYCLCKIADEFHGFSSLQTGAVILFRFRLTVPLPGAAVVNDCPVSIHHATLLDGCIATDQVPTGPPPSPIKEVRRLMIKDALAIQGVALHPSTPLGIRHARFQEEVAKTWTMLPRPVRYNPQCCDPALGGIASQTFTASPQFRKLSDKLIPSLPHKAHALVFTEATAQMPKIEMVRLPASSGAPQLQAVIGPATAVLSYSTMGAAISHVVPLPLAGLQGVPPHVLSLVDGAVAASIAPPGAGR